jgi:hypothetical protein
MQARCGMIHRGRRGLVHPIGSQFGAFAAAIEPSDV